MNTNPTGKPPPPEALDFSGDGCAAYVVGTPSKGFLEALAFNEDGDLFWYRGKWAPISLKASVAWWLRCDGVGVGAHRTADRETWETVQQGGQFEQWLEAISAALPG